MEALSLPYADINGARLRYVDKGNGPPLLLIHGLGASHDDWEKQIDFFARVFRVIAPDLRGHGDSEGEGPFTVERLASDLSQLLEQLKVATFFIAGHSMGGAVALQLALYKPERVQKMVLANTLPSFKPDSVKKQWQVLVRESIVRFSGVPALAKRTARNLFPAPQQEALRELVQLRYSRIPKKVYLALLKQLSGWSVDDKLSWLKMPVLVMAGDTDYFPQEEAIAFAESLPNGFCRIFESARHHLPLEKAEDFNRLCLDFLMPGSNTVQRGDGALNWLRIDPAAQQKIDVEALLKPK